MLTNSPWEYADLFKKITDKCINLLEAQRGPIYLLIDEVGFRKKGKHSACVGQQYIGSIGKSDNGQVAVTAALSAGAFYCPVEMELFMPKDWAQDSARREQAGIPLAKKQESKTLMALSMIKKLYQKLDAKDACVVFDALYGDNVDLLYQLINHQISFVGDIRDNLRVYLTKPSWKIPPYSGKGRRFTKKHPNKKTVKVRDYMNSLAVQDFKPLQVRNGTKGVLRARYRSKKVWVLHEPSKTFLPLQLLIRKEADGTRKYSLAFSPRKFTLKRMAKAQAQRVFVERIFEEGKNIVGMGDYQTRSWTGFHRHVALASLALLFLMEQKIALKTGIGKVTAYQIQQLVNAMICTLQSIDQVIEKLSYLIPQYQKQIQNQLKKVT